jgi:hypothetical protein
VGCILSEMLEGKPLFPGKDRAWPSESCANAVDLWFGQTS